MLWDAASLRTIYNLKQINILELLQINFLGTAELYNILEQNVIREARVVYLFCPFSTEKIK